MAEAFPQGQAWAHNMRRKAYISPENRPAFKMAIHRAGERWHMYLGHLWHSGWSIVDITDAAARPGHESNLRSLR